MTEMQKQFEEWFKQSHTGNVQKIDGEYVHGATERLWQAWQASRVAIVVKLPNLFDGSPDNATYYDYMYRKSEMEKALDDVGIDYE